MMTNKPILLVEDDDMDARTIQWALKELHVANPATRVVNGEEALAWLRDPANCRPGLILLDLNLPVMTATWASSMKPPSAWNSRPGSCNARSHSGLCCKSASPGQG